MARPAQKQSPTLPMPFSAQGPSIPLDAHVAGQDSILGYGREKIVFTSRADERISGWFAPPKGSNAAHPCILVLHGADGNKDTWWSADHPTGPLVPRLLDAGFAVFMLDAAHFGERRVPTAAEPTNPPDATSARPRFRDTILRTTSDYQRALDYLETRADVHKTARGVFGYSMGGIAATHLVAGDPRLEAGVICVAPPMVKTGGSLRLKHSRLATLAPELDGQALAGKPLLFIMARKDVYYSLDEAEVLFALVPGSAKQLKLFDSGHILPHAYIDDVVEWFTRHLMHT